MDAAVHCRARAKHARQLAETTLDHSLHDALLAMAQDYDELAEDLEHGAEAVRHPNCCPRRLPPCRERAWVWREPTWHGGLSAGIGPPDRDDGPAQAPHASPLRSPRCFVYGILRGMGGPFAPFHAGPCPPKSTDALPDRNIDRSAAAPPACICRAASSESRRGGSATPAGTSRSPMRAAANRARSASPPPAPTTPFGASRAAAARAWAELTGTPLEEEPQPPPP